MKQKTEFIVKREYEGSQKVSEAFEAIITPLILEQIKSLRESTKKEPE